MYYITQKSQKYKNSLEKKKKKKKTQPTKQATKHNHVPRDIPGFEWRGQLW